MKKELDSKLKKLLDELKLLRNIIDLQLRQRAEEDED